jgi:SAM-dependent methyltransferase
LTLTASSDDRRAEIGALLRKPEFPRSARYDPDFLLANQMGPNAVWLLEWLCEALRLEPEMRVLDLGCGRAMTSVFLAREFGVRVWAADLWMSPDNNWRRAREAGVADRVCPIRAEAHALPFAQGFFDAVVSIDAYQYFGTDDLYLGYLSRFVRDSGPIGVVVPGLTCEIGALVPEHLTRPQANGKRFWEDECWCFHTKEWWQALWRHCSQVSEVRTDTLTDGWRHWRDFERALERSGKGLFPSDAEALEADQGRTIGFVRAIARRTGETGHNLYDPSLGVIAGADT